MNIALRCVRTISAGLTVSGMLATAGVILAPIAFADYGLVRATTAVNIRSTPSPRGAILAVLYAGESVKQVGPVNNGWVPISRNGVKAWVSANYLTGVRASDDAPASQSGAAGAAFTTETLNARTGPTVSNSVITVLSKGTSVTLTGLVTTGWAQISLKGELAWVSRAWLSQTRPTASSSTRTVAAQARATADLMIRTAPGTSFRTLGDIPRGTILDLTGKTEPGVVQIIWRGEYRWVNATYVSGVSSAPIPGGPTIPKSIGTQYATASLDVRTTAGSDAVTITEVPAGTALEVTGVVKNGRAEIVWNGASRSVTAQYLSSTKPVTDVGSDIGNSQGLEGLTPNAKAVVLVVRQRYPFIKTIYGVRPDSIPDHPSGLAVDLMLPNWSTAEGRAAGWEVANWMRANASSLNIQYIIFDQKIWNAARDSEGWRSMADRGSATANHKDHVHITVKP